MLSCRGSGRARDNATGCECPRRNGTQLQGGWRGVSSNMLWSQSSRSTCISTGLSRVGLGLRRLEEGVGQLAKPHGHGLRHVGRLGVHDGIEERLQVGLRVPADVHDLVAGWGGGCCAGSMAAASFDARGTALRFGGLRRAPASPCTPCPRPPPLSSPPLRELLPSSLSLPPAAAASQLRQKLWLQTPKLKSCEERPPARLAGSASSTLFLPLRARPHRIRGPRPPGKLSLRVATFLQTPGRT